ncbi:MAG TPA: hypothetical protein VEK08_22565 [Planctomycetota bacterium]|nr:hypothetical protein [Planctomycetota bacterium]
MASGQGPPGERLARLETQIEQLVNATNRTHADLREHIQWQRKSCETQDRRLAALENSAEQTRVHLKWMKAIWLAVQGSVIGWLGLK